MSAARVRFTPKSTTARRSGPKPGCGSVTWSIGSTEANRCVARMPVVNGSSDTNSSSTRLRRMSVASTALMKWLTVLCATHTPPMKAKLTK